jgi:ferredoxin
LSEDPSDRFTVVIEPAGLSYVARADVPVLQSAREAGLILPSSCRNGTCRTCMCRLVSGRVRYAIEWPGLSPEEKAEGFILPCVAIPETALVVESTRLEDLRSATCSGGTGPRPRTTRW